MESPENLSVSLERKTALAIVALAAILRLTRLGTESLWTDEAWSWWIATCSHESFWQLLTSDVHPPGYYLVLRLWITIAGASASALRIPSALCGIASVAALYLVARPILRRRVALLAAGLLALSPFHIFYSQETRGYSQLTLFTILSTGALIHWLRSPRQRRLFLFIHAAATVGALYTHYAAVLLVAAHLSIFAGWRLRTVRLREKVPRGQDFQWVVAQALIGFSFLPGASLMATQATAMGDSLWISAPSSSDALRTAILLVGLQVPGAPTPSAGVAMFAVAFILTLSTLAGLTPSGRALLGLEGDTLTDSGSAASLWLLIPWVVIPPLTALVLSHFGVQIFTPRNLIVTLPGTILLIATFVMSRRSLILRFLLLAVALGLPTAGITALLHGNLKEEWRDAAALVRVASQSDDLFLYDAWFARPAMEYSLGRATSTVFSSHDIPPHTKRLWLVRSHSRDTERRKADELRAMGFVPRLSQSYRGVELQLLLRGDEAASIRLSPSTSTMSRSRGATKRRSHESSHE